MDHEDDPDDPIVLVDPPGRKTRRAKFDPRYPRVRAPAALLELKSWALRDFVVATGVGVLVDTAKEAAAFAGCDYHGAELQGLDLRWPLRGAGATRRARGLESAARLLTGAVPWKKRSTTISRWSQWPLSQQQLVYAACDAFFSREAWFALQGWAFGKSARLPPEHVSLLDHGAAWHSGVEAVPLDTTGHLSERP